MRAWRARYGAAPSSYDWSRTHAHVPAEPDAITEAEWEERAAQSFSGKTTAGTDGLRRMLANVARDP
jgi:hypothetical protein